MPKLTRGEFKEIRQLAHEQFGLDLKAGKEELVSARLNKKVRQGGFRSFREYYQHVLDDTTGEELIALINALTTNHTSFMREATHFEFLTNKVLPALRSRSQIRIWCAASATGEEPYTIAFTMLDALAPSAKPEIRILATDISTRALETGRRGVYPAGRFDTLPKLWLRRYMLKGRGASEGYYKVRPEVRDLIEYRRLNLIESFSHPFRYPVIFCRNVMIYFDQQTRQDVVNRLAESLEPGGYLFLGHSEGLTAIDHQLDYVQPATYRKPDRESRRDGGGRTKK